MLISILFLFALVLSSYQLYREQPKGLTTISVVLIALGLSINFIVALVNGAR